MTDKNMMLVEDPDSGPDAPLQINIPRRRLGDFLGGLLGQARSIERVTRKPFVIDMAFICNLDSILEQRITSQQHASLTALSARVFFDDERAVTITSREALRSFHDISTARTVGVEVVWTYLIQFPNRALPEKQVISLTAVSNRDKLAAVRDDDPLPLIALLVAPDIRSSIRINIEYTELTWGLDILNYMQNDVSKTLLPGGWVSRRLREVARLGTIAILPFGAIGGMVFLYERTRKAGIRSIREEIMKTIEAARDFENIVKLKLDYIMTETTSNVTGFGTSFWVSAFAVLLTVISVGLLVFREPRSFVILNDASKIQYSKFMTWSNNMRWAGLVGFVVGVVSGVASNKVTNLIDRLLSAL